MLNRLLRAGETKLVKRLAKYARVIEDLEPEMQALSDAELRAKTDEFRARLRDGESLDDLMFEAFAVVREAAVRTLGQRAFPVQLMGGGALHFGNIAEMKTGEGKTLTSAFPVYLNALTGEGVHVVTTNDYLAKRDSENMGRIHRFLGLTVGVILSEMPPAVRREQYAADITYGTNNEFGFDYLRDNMAWKKADMVQRGHNFAIVDEADSILIDEARTPLIISGPAEASSRWYQAFADMVNGRGTAREPMRGFDVTGMSPQELNRRSAEIQQYHYEYDLKKRTVGITDKGVRYVEDQLGIDNLYEAANTPLIGYLNNALKAKELFKKDRDYIVRDGQVLIVDEFTGRVLPGRRYSEGMHQAIEAKEQVPIQNENQTLATITLQNYFRLYKKLSGMTGTAQTEAAELHQIYKLGVVPIPTNRPMIRKDQPDLIYKTEEAKFAAVAADIAERHRKGQPVLVGTTSVEKSEYLSKLLRQLGVPHNVLNAKHHEKEAAIIAQAGQAGAVTVATNMAGRGTDIMLGGNPEFLADQELRRRGLDPVETREEYEAAWDETLQKMREQVAEEAEEVRAAGGLYVIGTERHESRRIDNQLRGRSGRQGDPGESRFYLSLGDDLMRRFNGQLVESIMNRFNLPDDVPIEAGMVTKAIRSAQTQVEQQNFEIRKNVLKYDEVLNKQRAVIYAERRRVLDGENIKSQIEHMLEDVIKAYVDGATAEGYAEDWDLEKLWTGLRAIYPIGIRWQDLAGEDGEGDIEDLTKERLYEAILADAKAAYARREAEIDELIGPLGGMRELERHVLLTVIDRKWREHLYEMDYLKEGIQLRAMAQRDPVIEYQREGYDMFKAMSEGIKEETVTYLFNATLQPAQPAGAAQQQPAAGQAPAQEAPPARQAPARASGGRHAAPAAAEPADASSVLPAAFRGSRPTNLSYSGPAEDGGTVRSRSGSGGRNGSRGEATVTGTAQPSRNRPCPCGSGRKYKQCHGSPTAARP
ncbi:MAG TPA: preprotein translocase subunit SecA [Pseudonocardia sp.]|nr:preprotein translocase subunit SecA [Pseudonocardia sp.]HLU56274.1 preprotein translocase subunit SecA [Pseudonocardia sp.]